MTTISTTMIDDDDTVIVTPKAGKGTGMVAKAAELAEKHGWFLCHQFETDANWKFHYETTVCE